ncbi:MAG: DUF1254 domain-containing protein [Streptosporangiaceae bacterium]
MSGASGLSADQVQEIGVRAYIYAYPLLTMDVTRGQATNIGADTMPGRGPMNTFSHIREFPAADFKMVVRANFDTLYSSAWLDLRDGPIVVSAGADPDGRYYELPMYDMWTDAFAAPGQRTSGTGPGNWAVIPPGWNGDLPEGVDRIDAPTPMIWIIGRTQTDGPDDYPAVHKIQDAYRLVPLARWGAADAAAQGTAAPDPSVDMTTPPLDQVNAMSAASYFDYAMALMAVHPPHLTDGPLMMQMRRIGLVPGARFTGLDPAVQKALGDVPAAAMGTMQEAFPRLSKVVNGWQMNIDTMGVYGNFYLKRSIIAMVGLGANSPEDAIYPMLMADADGAPISGEHDYVLHFDRAELPPVEAFWSVTMYDTQGFQAANTLDRFAIGDRDPLRYNADGSLDLYLQHDSPGQDKESNWLPAPRGPLGITMRLYSPEAAVINGLWNPPAVRKA